MQGALNTSKETITERLFTQTKDYAQLTMQREVEGNSSWFNLRVEVLQALIIASLQYSVEKMSTEVHLYCIM